MSKGSGISRRSFLSMTGVAALGAAGASMVGCSSTPTASSSSSTSSSSDADPIEPVSVPETWDEEADVVVCGTGGGLVAAVYAAKQGKKVVVLEKAESYGGTSKETDIFSVMGSKTQQALYGALAEQFAASEDATQQALAAQFSALAAMDPSVMKEQWYNSYYTMPNGGSEGTLPDGTEGLRSCGTDVPLMNALIDNIPDAVDFIGEQGVVWGPVTKMGSSGYMAGVCPEGSEAGGFVARANYSVFETLYNVAVDAGVTFHFLTPATALVEEDGKIVGVQCDGEVTYVKANDGVLLAMGGMANNKDMLEKYIPHGLQALTSTASGDEGDGIRMGLGAGAAIAGLDSASSFDGGLDCGSWGHYLYKGDVQLARQPWCLVNILGNRVPYYPLDTLGFTKQSAIHMAQPGHKSYCIFDADYETNIRKFNQMICRNPIWPEMEDEGADFSRLPESVCEHDWRIGVQQALDGGWLYEADTIEELGEMMGFADGVLPAAVEHYNEICEAGVDDEYHYDPEWLCPVQNPPYYGIATGATILCTYTGLQVNEKMQVTTENGTVIEGLYASGTTAGGFSGSCSYGESRHPGGGVAMSCGTAYRAAKTMCGVE